MRADLYLSENGYAPSRQRARMMIEAGCVTIDGKTVKKPSEPVGDGEHCICVSDPLSYVGRGGLKLEAAIKAFCLDMTDKTALDIGASTGGFTDCLLQHGAARVYAVDSGEGQLAAKLRRDPRVISREHLNARELTVEHTEGACVDVIVMDVSFISATYLLPRFPALLREDGVAVCLIKPQFEVGRQMLGKGGIVKAPAAHLYAVERVTDSARALGLSPIALIPSPIFGGDGNLEFLICLKHTASATKILTAEEIKDVVKGAEKRC